MAYNPYSAINAIYNYKNEWDSANNAGDTNKKNKAAENAKVFYQQLRDNGYGKVADQLSAVDVTGAKYILDQYSTKNSGVDNQAYSTTMQSAVDKNNKLAGYIDSDRTDVQGKYNNIYNYANQDVTKTDEYKSTYDNLMKKYDMSALQGRDNAVASGGASNGGNIDSYAAANALRQQASITAQGQQIAHQAGLDAYNARVSNVTNILNNLGVYNDSTYSAMDKTVNNDLNIANNYFANAETAKNNETARQEVYSNISGTVGDRVTKWLNGNIWNDDGSLSNYNTDYQASINELEKAYNATTDEKQRASILEQLRVLEMARNQKIDEQGLTYGKTYKYQSDKQSEAGRQWDMQDATTRESLKTEQNIAASNNATEQAIANAANQNALDQIAAQTQGQKEIIDATAKAGNVKVDKNGNVVPVSEGDLLGTGDSEWDKFKGYFSDADIKKFLEEKLKPYVDSGKEINEEVLEELIVGADATNSNSTTYDIDVEDAKEISKYLSMVTGVELDTSWIDKYKNRGWWFFNKNKGMKPN